MVLQVLAHARQIVGHFNAELAQFGGRPDARVHQQHRGIDGPGRDDYLAPRPDLPGDPARLDLDAHGASAFEKDAPHQALRHELEVWALEVGLEIARRRRAAPAIAHVELHDADAVDALAVEVAVVGILQARAGFDEGAGVSRGVLDVGDGHGAALTAVGVGAGDVVLHALEVGQHVLVAPAAGAEGLPGVVVAGRAAQEDKAVDRTRAAQHPAARPAEPPTVETGLGLGLIAPVDARIGYQLAEAQGNVDPRIAVALARLDQAHLDGGVLR